MRGPELRRGDHSQPPQSRLIKPNYPVTPTSVLQCGAQFPVTAPDTDTFRDRRGVRSYPCGTVSRPVRSGAVTEWNACCTMADRRLHAMINQANRVSRASKQTGSSHGQPVRPRAVPPEAIDADTTELNQQMIALMTGLPDWWVVGPEATRAARLRGEGPFPRPSVRRGRVS